MAFGRWGGGGGGYERAGEGGGGGCEQLWVWVVGVAWAIVYAKRVQLKPYLISSDLKISLLPDPTTGSKRHRSTNTGPPREAT